MLYRVIQQHLPAFLEQAREHGGVPGFVEDAFQEFLRCGVLGYGLCRFRCSACSCERLVALSCKGCGMCPSCGGKRMSELAAHVVDRVIPRVPVRQWVLSLPHALRYRLAYDHPRMVAVFGLFVRAVCALTLAGPKRPVCRAGRRAPSPSSNALALRQICMCTRTCS